MFVLDTNIISEVLKGASGSDRGVWRWYEETPLDDLYLSVIVLGEIRKGTELIRPHDSGRAAKLERWLRELKLVYRGRILSISEEVCDAWGRIAAKAKVSTSDGLIGATAAFHRMTVVTRNEGDFQRIGVDYLNPFTGRTR